MEAKSNRKANWSDMPVKVARQRSDNLLYKVRDDIARIEHGDDSSESIDDLIRHIRSLDSWMTLGAALPTDWDEVPSKDEDTRRVCLPDE